MNQPKPTPDELRIRVMAAKKQLPKTIIPTMLHIWPEMNGNKVSNVLQLRTYDEEITKKLELLITKLKS